jgi:hypothetical protein
MMVGADGSRLRHATLLLLYLHPQTHTSIVVLVIISTIFSEALASSEIIKIDQRSSIDNIDLIFMVHLVLLQAWALHDGAV